MLDMLKSNNLVFSRITDFLSDLRIWAYMFIVGHVPNVELCVLCAVMCRPEVERGREQSQIRKYSW
jgi:hypothetical protein